MSREKKWVSNELKKITKNLNENLIKENKKRDNIIEEYYEPLLKYDRIENKIKINDLKILSKTKSDLTIRKYFELQKKYKEITERIDDLKFLNDFYYQNLEKELMLTEKALNDIILEAALEAENLNKNDIEHLDFLRNTNKYIETKIKNKDKKGTIIINIF